MERSALPPTLAAIITAANEYLYNSQMGNVKSRDVAYDRLLLAVATHSATIPEFPTLQMQLLIAKDTHNDLLYAQSGEQEQKKSTWDCIIAIARAEVERIEALIMA